jgi:hypothetical protein
MAGVITVFFFKKKVHFIKKVKKSHYRVVCTGFWWGNLRERDHWGNPGIYGRIILRWILKKWDVGVWTGLS